MEIVNIHEAKTNLSRLLEKAGRGEPFIIAKAGRPIARVTGIDAPEPSATRRLGFLLNEVQVPDDFDRMGEQEINDLFEGSDDSAS